MYVAVNDQQRITMAEIAEFYGISHEHLRKVVHRLSSLGYLRTYHGKGGGMELNKAPEKINIGRLFLEFEGAKPLIDCNKSRCPLRASCELSQLFASAQDIFINEIKQHSLADLLTSTATVKKLGN